MGGPIRIVCATNDSYAKHLAVMLTSLMLNKKTRMPVNIYIIDGGSLSKESKAKLVNAMKPYHVPVTFIKFNNSKLKHIDSLKIYKRYGKEAFYRIFIPELFGKDVQRVLYLDCDIIVKRDISPLWNKSLNRHFLAAVKDPSAKKMAQKLGIPKNHYFNSGVLLIDLAKWRHNQISKKVLHYIQKHPRQIRFPDQDGLNAVLHDKALQLNIKWNCPAFWSDRYPAHAILHFITKQKPWNHHPRGKDQYLKYLSKTVWSKLIRR